MIDAEEDEVPGLSCSWRGEPMDGGELVGGPDGEDDEEDEAREIDGAASAKAGVAANVDHAGCRRATWRRRGEFWGRGSRMGQQWLGDERADEQTCGHAGEAKEESLEGDLIGGFEWRERREDGGFLS